MSTEYVNQVTLECLMNKEICRDKKEKCGE